MFSDLPPLELNNTGSYVPLPLNGQGGKVTIKVPAFAPEDVGSYEIGIYNGDNNEPGFIASLSFAIAPYARFPIFEIPASLSSPRLGMRLLSHAELETKAFTITPQWQGSNSSSNLMVSLGITVDALAASVAAVLGNTTPSYEQLNELVSGLELARATMLAEIEAQAVTVDNRSLQNSQDIATQGQQLATVDNRSSQNSQDIATQGQQLATVDNRSSQNSQDILNFPKPFNPANPGEIGGGESSNATFKSLTLKDTTSFPPISNRGFTILPGLHGTGTNTPANVIELPTDLLLGAGARFNVSAPNYNCFNSDENDRTSFLQNAEESLQVDFGNISENGITFFFGQLVLIFGWSGRPENLKIELFGPLTPSSQDRNWYTIYDEKPTEKFYVPVVISIAKNFVRYLKITITSGSISTALTRLSFFMGRGSNKIPTTFAPLNSSTPQSFYSPGIQVIEGEKQSSLTPEALELSASDGSRWRYHPDIDGTLEIQQIG